ncbi:cell adhesion molecule 4-like [Pecten maximus]|uniref:cell adhesion molecule 4-like n=1 Tax=Pecten maximus TaxID=6579 RepID=UPI001458DF85|nr:cell adhesion molecule 4-like [Pecten maximus]
MVDEKFDRRQCICTAEHQASPEGHFGKVAILFDILYKPTITLDQSVATIREGESFNRTCSAQGNPKPIIHWYHGRRHLTTTENLQFKNIDRTNAGEYACIALAISHDISLQSTKSFNIAVQCE